MIRVLRVLEYEYDDAEQFARDRMNWQDHFRRGGRPAGQGWTPRWSMQSSIVSITAIDEPMPEADGEVSG